MICHHYKCIFVHIPKNAGQSVEHVFLNLIGLNWRTRAPLLLRYNDNPDLGPERLAHLTAEQYVSCKHAPQDMFDEYFKFAFVRNPWDRMVSFYKYLGYDNKMEFNIFVKEHFIRKIQQRVWWFVRPQTDYIYKDEGHQLVDFIGRFESLQSDFDIVCQKIGLPATLLPRVNVSEKKGPGMTVESGLMKLFEEIKYVLNLRTIPSFNSYRDYYSQESIDLVAEFYKRDVQLLSYDF